VSIDIKKAIETKILVGKYIDRILAREGVDPRGFPLREHSDDLLSQEDIDKACEDLAESRFHDVPDDAPAQCKVNSDLSSKLFNLTEQVRTQYESIQSLNERIEMLEGQDRGKYIEYQSKIIIKLCDYLSNIGHGNAPIMSDEFSAPKDKSDPAYIPADGVKYESKEAYILVQLENVFLEIESMRAKFDRLNGGNDRFFDEDSRFAKSYLTDIKKAVSDV